MLIVHVSTTSLKAWSASARQLYGKKHGQALGWFDLGNTWGDEEVIPDTVNKFCEQYRLRAGKMGGGGGGRWETLFMSPLASKEIPQSELMTTEKARLSHEKVFDNPR